MTRIPGYPRSLRRFRIPVWAALGGCLHCTRAAFRSAIVAWCISSLALAICTSTRILLLIGVTASALTGLWLAHLLAHALKACRRASATNQTGFSRRAVMPLFARALAAAAFVTAMPRLALAQCSEDRAAHCHSDELDCHAGCDRLFHRDERNHACHQECASNATECKAEAGCR